MSHFKRFFILVAALVALLDLAALAQTQTPSPNPLPPPVDRTRSKEAQKKVAATESDVKKAQQALAEVVGKLRTDFESGQDWQNAAGAQKQAQADYDAAKKPVVEAVKKRLNYQDAERQKAAAEKELAARRDQDTI